MHEGKPIELRSTFGGQTESFDLFWDVRQNKRAPVQTKNNCGSQWPIPP